MSRYLISCATRRGPLLAVYMAVAVGAGIAAAATAAQDPAAESPLKVTGSLQASPAKAGTVSHPAGLTISGVFKLSTPSDMEPPVITGLELMHGPGWAYSGASYTKCAKATLERSGPSGCPRRSIMGTVTATGWADTVTARVDATIVNGPGGRLMLYARLDNPARVRETVTGTIEDIARGPWRHRETWAVPRSLQVVAGIPLQITHMKFEVGGRSYAKHFTSSTSCPRGGWTWRLVVHTLSDSAGTTGDSVLEGAIPCRR